MLARFFYGHQAVKNRYYYEATQIDEIFYVALHLAFQFDITGSSVPSDELGFCFIGVDVHTHKSTLHCRVVLVTIVSSPWLLLQIV